MAVFSLLYTLVRLETMRNFGIMILLDLLQRSETEILVLAGGEKVATFTVAELENMIVVNMGDYKTSRGEKKLLTKDLGSCVGVAVRDPR